MRLRRHTRPVDTSFATARLSSDLTPYVRSLVGARLRGGVPGRALELPVAGTAVILELGHRWRVAADRWTPLTGHRCFVGGLTLAPAVTEHDGDFDLVEFVLTPLGTAAVLGVPAAALAGLVVTLEDILGREAERLAGRLAAHGDWTARLAVTEQWLRDRIARAPELLSPDVAWVLRRVDATGGRVAIGALQDEIGCSRRHLATCFAQSVGTTPKAYAQLVRFGRARDRLRAGESPAAVAALCGYSDQAHLTRQVQRFGATTPALLRRGTPVTTVQDAALPAT